MPINVTEYNARFSSFVDFAEKSAATGNRKAVANASETLAGRKIAITASKTDAAYSALRRSAEDKEVNDRTRALFLKAVGDMFGGADRIPESVRAKMKMNDYEKGRPLTARRILEVKAAVDAELSSRTFDDALAKYGNELGPDEAKFARKLFSSHTAGMRPVCAAMFARYVFALDLAGEQDDKDAVAAKAGRMANEMKTWRDIGYGDADMDAPRNVIQSEITSYVTDMVAQKSFCEKEGLQNISRAFYADCDRSDITINGQHIDAEIGKDAIVGIFKKAVPGAKAQQLISWAMNQSLSSALTYTANGSEMPMHDGSGPVNIRNLPGGKLLVGRNGEEHFGGLAAAKNISYRLDVSADGKTATLVNEMDSLLMVGDRIQTSGTGFGSAKQSIKVTFDLSNPEAPFISGVDVSQTLGADDPVRN